jgi:hemerythrin superfamily protein
MDLHELPFAKIIVLDKDLAEVLINEGVEMNTEMVAAYHDFLLAHLQAPFSLLVNKVNAYSYDFEAQANLATLEQINAMAVVTYNRISTISTESLASMPRSKEWNLRIFSDRGEALAWLRSEQPRVTEAGG